jgi:hypothetical protein
MKFLKLIKLVLIFSILTLFTQIGGLIYLFSSSIYSILKWSKLEGFRESLRRFSFHFTTYLIFTFFIIPPIAGFFGRVPLPVFSENNLGPRTIWTVILNRHYVRPKLRETVSEITLEISQKYPSVRINYFDANHPFFKGYPLFPHLSHNDGKKLDLGFIYNNATTNCISKNTPSLIGYGISEEPFPSEYNRPAECGANNKYWMYNFMRHIYPQGAKNKYVFNSILTRELIFLFSANSRIQKVLLEPHLKTRLKFTSDKIKQVQCGSVRHDDHFHVQIY